ncbi:MAG: ATP-binding protein [bacterium]
MDLQNIILITVVVLDIILGILIISKNYRKEINISYSISVLWLTLWAFGIAMFRYTTNADSLFFWNREFILAAGFITSGLLHFSFVFPYSSIKLTILKRFLIYVPNVFVFLAVMTPGVLIKDIIVRSWGNESILGWGYIYYGIYFSVFSIWAFVNLLLKHRKSTGIARAQLFYVLLGLSTSLIFGATFNLFFILLGNYRYIWLGPYASFIMLAFFGYAILKYRLMDIRVAVRQSSVYVFSFLNILALSFGVHYLLNVFFTLSSLLEVLIIAGISVCLFHFLTNFYLKIANRFFFYSLYSYQETINKLTDKLISILDIDKLTDTIVKEIMDVMKLNRAGVLLKEEGIGEYKIQHIIGFREDNGISLVKNNFLTKRLEQTKKPVVYEELGMQIRDANDENVKGKLINLQSNMKKIEAELCLPLISRDKLKGIIVLGKKLSGEAYSVQDLNLLDALAGQASLAIENARLYDQVQDFSKNLKSRVNEQTKEIREKTNSLEDLLKKNQALSQMKTEFLRVVNHQLRTPTSIIKGMLSMLVEGSIDGEKKKEEAIDKVYSSADRLETILDDILDAQDLVDGKPNPNLKPTSLEELINKVISPMLILAKQKKIKLEFKKPIKQLPKILLDAVLIEKALKKIIDNAVLYTEKGNVIINAEIIKNQQTQKELVKITIKDSGVGITDADKSKLFRIFTRGAQAERIHQNGSGLGLYIANEYIKANQGKIEVESEGKNKGTMFTIILPVITEV